MIPLSIEHAIQRALEIVKQDDAGALKPYHRKRFLDFFVASKGGERARQRLDYSTARHVEHIWRETLPDLRLPKMALESMACFLSGVANDDNLSKIEVELASYLENDIAGMPTSMYRALWAVFSSYAALQTFTSSNSWLDPTRTLEIPFASIITDEELTDYYADAAKYASFAVAGRFGEEDFQLEERQRFWEWWLQEASRQAWSEN